MAGKLREEAHDESPSRNPVESAPVQLTVFTSTPPQMHRSSHFLVSMPKRLSGMCRLLFQKNRWSDVLVVERFCALSDKSIGVSLGDEVLEK